MSYTVVALVNKAYKDAIVYRPGTVGISFYNIQVSRPSEGQWILQFVNSTEFVIMNSHSMTDVLTPYGDVFYSDGDGDRRYCDTFQPYTGSITQRWTRNSEGNYINSGFKDVLATYQENAKTVRLILSPAFGTPNELWVHYGQYVMNIDQNMLRVAVPRREMSKVSLSPSLKMPGAALLAPNFTLGTELQTAPTDIEVTAVGPAFTSSTTATGLKPYFYCYFDASKASSIDWVYNFYKWKSDKSSALPSEANSINESLWQGIMMTICASVDADTGIHSLVSNTGKLGTMCGAWYRDRAGNETSRAELQRVKDTIVSTYCTSHPEAEECACYNRINDPIYKKLKPGVPADDRCWYAGCAETNKTQLMLTEELDTTPVCPTTICTNILSVADSENLDLNSIAQTTNCDTKAAGGNGNDTNSSMSKEEQTKLYTGIGIAAGVGLVVLAGAGIAVLARKGKLTLKK